MLFSFKFQIWRNFTILERSKGRSKEVFLLFVCLSQAILLHVNGREILLRRGFTGWWSNKGSGV